MQYQPILAVLLLLPWLATAENGVTPLSQQQGFLNPQQQRVLNNQQMEQRRQQQSYQLKMNQPKMLPYSGNNNPMQPMMTNSNRQPNGNQPLNPFNQAAPAIPPAPLPVIPARP